MGKKIEYGLGKISATSLSADKNKAIQEKEPKLEDLITRVTIAVNYPLLDLIRRYARDKGMSQGDALIDALARFFEKHPPSERPQEVVEREKEKMSNDKRRRWNRLIA